ncbi:MULTISPECIES: hypothetical protein [Saccharothrix]|uniref:hypothetical protein n=1 Tax=Saccharothrix TaxID=2071 RepID=UPI00093DBC1A|nr:hypothetical protein [Saccharothrix sp. CB00851]OKI21589.1 hypothetical protein A6A25_09900 [Saccharothrix sp. CB00851]
MGAGGHVHMDVAGLRDAVGGLEERGRGLLDSWRTRQQAIGAFEAGIGSDVLGQAFRGIYTAPSTALRAAADGVPRALVEDAEIGRRCAEDYRAADRSAADAFRSAGS